MAQHHWLSGAKANVVSKRLGGRAEERRTAAVCVVEVEERKVISVRVSELRLCFVGLLALTVGSEIRVGDCADDESASAVEAERGGETHRKALRRY